MKVTFRINYNTYWGQNVLIMGSTSELGNWDKQYAAKMTYISNGNWEYTVELSPSILPILYTYIVCEANHPDIREYGYPHTIEYKSQDLVCNDSWQEQDTCKLFRDKPAKWRAAGVSIPIFSLRSEKSFGIGEFSDLKLLIDWACKTGMQVIQILPVNDTTMTHSVFDSYPYNAISIYALNPLYLNLGKMGLIDNKEIMQRYKTLKAELDTKEELQYEQVDSFKWEYFHLLYEQEKDVVAADSGFQWFIQENEEWLIPYSLYCCLRDIYHTSDFRSWGECAFYRSKKVQKLLQKKEMLCKMRFYQFLQYHLHLQLQEMHEYAVSKNILLKGDIPIGISRNSVEAWVEPEYFHLDAQTGAPPDDFSQTGQNWGFPTYDWDAMKKDGYQWWLKRFRNMARYFDLYRIDHILGFFRIWEIPQYSIQGLLGHFSPSLPLSIDEIETYGISFDKNKMTLPYITEELLSETFGEYTDEVSICFFERNKDNTFHFKKQFNTQQKIANQTGWQNDEKNRNIREKLYALTNEVLFIEDPVQKEKYHPRIALYNSYIFKSQDTQTQEKLYQLHNDYFYIRHNEFWKEEALFKLPPLLSSTDMLGCGEDLGMVPQCVPEVMEMLQLLSLEIERMPKAMYCEFGDTKSFPYRSVCATSTHDMNGLRGWWKEDMEKSQHYYNQILKRDGTAPEELSEELCEQILLNHLQSPSMLALFPFQDWVSISHKVRRTDYTKERINVPSNPQNKWNYRMHLTLESLVKEESLNRKIKQLITSSNR